MKDLSGRIGVVGAGSWGTTLANLLATKGHAVDLWVYEEDLCRIIAETRENTFYLPGHKLHENVAASNDLEKVTKGHQLLLMVVPSHVYRPVATLMLPHIDPGSVVVSATKGIENDSLMIMSQVWEDIGGSPDRFHTACLAGPSFAREVIKEIPTAITVAADSLKIAQWVQNIFHTPFFRAYTSLDKIGVELAGALKNVIALAVGASDGLGFGLNSRAALITRGLAEISRVAVEMGGNPLTLLGLSGVGDLVLTCTGDLSRNRTVGYMLGQGKKLADILAEMRMVAEGVKTAKSAFQLSARENVDMPISEQVYRVLYEDKDPSQAVWDLIGRDPKHELPLNLEEAKV